jgi:hypothetical protein
MDLLTDHATNRIELYLMKKELRLESSSLVQRAKLTVPMMQASKLYKNSVGAALRSRLDNKSGHTTGISEI